MVFIHIANPMRCSDAYHSRTSSFLSSPHTQKTATRYGYSLLQLERAVIVTIVFVPFLLRRLIGSKKKYYRIFIVLAAIMLRLNWATPLTNINTPINVIAFHIYFQIELISVKSRMISSTSGRCCERIWDFFYGLASFCGIVRNDLLIFMHSVTILQRTWHGLNGYLANIKTHKCSIKLICCEKNRNLYICSLLSLEF